MASVAYVWDQYFSFPLPVTGQVPPPGTLSLQVNLATTGPANTVNNPGDWLFCIIGWRQLPYGPPVTWSVSDDSAGQHNWWEPVGAPNGVSSPNGLSRVSVWMCPKANGCQNVMVAPTGYSPGVAVTVLDVTGMGPYVTVETAQTVYANGVTSLSGLAAGPPASNALLVTSLMQDSRIGSTPTLTGAGWGTYIGLAGGSNGIDHTGDTVLTTYAQFTTGSTSVAWSGLSQSQDLASVLVSVLVNGTALVPLSPNWPVTILEAAPGAGYQTPPDQLAWVPLTTRYLKLDFTQGRQYELATLSAGEGTVVLDNWDGSLLPPGTGSFAGISSGTPIRLRCLWPGGAWQVSFHGNGSTANPQIDTGVIAAVTAGATYTASAWLGSSVAWAAGIYLSIVWKNSGGGVLSTTSSAGVTGPAAVVATVSGTAPAGATQADLLITAEGTPPSSVIFYASAPPS